MVTNRVFPSQQPNVPETGVVTRKGIGKVLRAMRDGNVGPDHIAVFVFDKQSGIATQAYVLGKGQTATADDMIDLT